MCRCAWGARRVGYAGVLGERVLERRCIYRRSSTSRWRPRRRLTLQLVIQGPDGISLRSWISHTASSPWRTVSATVGIASSITNRVSRSETPDSGHRVVAGPRSTGKALRHLLETVSSKHSIARRTSGEYARSSARTYRACASSRERQSALAAFGHFATLARCIVVDARSGRSCPTFVGSSPLIVCRTSMSTPMTLDHTRSASRLA